MRSATAPRNGQETARILRETVGKKLISNTTKKITTENNDVIMKGSFIFCSFCFAFFFTVLTSYYQNQDFSFFSCNFLIISLKFVINYSVTVYIF